MSEYLVKSSREIVWCEQDDRFVLVIKEFDEIVGLNFMQGEEYDEFLASYSESDSDLTRFYLAVENSMAGKCELDRINQAMWAWLRYKNNF